MEVPKKLKIDLLGSSYCGSVDTYNAAQQWEKKLCINVCVTGSPCCTVEKKSVLGEISIKYKLKKILQESLTQI